MSILQMSLMTDDEIEYTTDYIQIMNNIESDQPIAAQSKPHSNPDPRINSIFTSIQNAGFQKSLTSIIQVNGEILITHQLVFGITENYGFYWVMGESLQL